MKKKVVLIEDDRDLNMLTQAVLKDEGYDVAAFMDAESAIKYMQENEYDVIITDYKLPEMNGLDMLKKMKEDTKDVEKYMITAYGSNAIKQEANELGVNYIFDKPYTYDDLLNRLERKSGM